MEAWVMVPDCPWWQIVGVAVVGALVLGFLGAPFWLWWALSVAGLVVIGASPILIGLVVAVGAVFLIPPLRKGILSGPLLGIMKPLMPRISETERTALEAGVVWREADLFSGKPDFKKMMEEPYPQLTEEERAFLEGPTEKLCAMIDEWQIWTTRDIPQPIMDFIKKERFLGMIIPKEYGGLGFSAFAHSEVIQKISSRSIAVAIVVMVPNSLGPAELLVHYGTQPQKDRYLKRLALGDEIPCFGLTEPEAGSDAGSITATGVLFKDGGTLKIRLNWNKRWITLSPIATLIGLAFRLKDPENILGKGEDLGITCALIPSTTPGVWVGHRHDPMGVPFHNGPTRGEDVVVNAEDAIIGGMAQAGHGWTMLMESLGAGRGISLPALSVGGVKLAYRAVSGHAVIRRQFGVPIGFFEGIEEPMARIAGSAYSMEALRRYVLGALDQGVKPPVVTAMAKYMTTEVMRRSLTDAMDVLAGQGLSLGPRNILGVPYLAVPIGITVEGANILTRTLMVFGQGAFRAHPYAFKEVDAVMSGNVAAFDAAFWAHIGHVVRNFSRAVVLSLSRGYVGSCGYGKGMGRYFQKLAWSSAVFALMADLAMGLLGGQLKIKEKLTGRFADILSWMLIATAVLRRYQYEGFRADDRPFVDYSLRSAFAEIQKAFDGIFENFDVPVLGALFRGPLRWWSGVNRLQSPPTDRLSHLLAREMMRPGEHRDRMTGGIYVPAAETDALGRMEKALRAVVQAEAVERKIRQAIKAKSLPKRPLLSLLDDAVSRGIISGEEKALIGVAEKLRVDAIQVDDFSWKEYARNT